jgi:hypothetical protein
MKEKREQISRDYESLVNLYRLILDANIIDMNNLPSVGGEASGIDLAQRLVAQREKGEWNILNNIIKGVESVANQNHDPNSNKGLFTTTENSVTIKPIFLRKTDAGAGYFVLPHTFLNIGTTYNQRTYSVPNSL